MKDLNEQEMQEFKERMLQRALEKTEWGFDLTDFKSRDKLKEFCQKFGLAEKPMELKRTVSFLKDADWVWEGPTMNMVTARNPFIPKRSEGEEAFVSYMVLEGYAGAVQEAGNWLQDNSDDLEGGTIYVKGTCGIGHNGYISGIMGFKRKKR